jgi:hypothetical protein
MEIEDEQSWFRAKIAYLRMIIPLVAIPRAEAGLQTLAKAMDARLAALRQRRLNPFAQDDPPGKSIIKKRPLSRPFF